MWNNTGNILLHRDDVGKSKPPTFTLPDEEFVYGRNKSQPRIEVKECSIR